MSSDNRAHHTADRLLAQGLIAPEDHAAVATVAQDTAVALTGHLRDHMTPALARQFVPSASELDITPEDLADPIGDAPHSPIKGIVHRYPDRVLLMPHAACPAYCRFCFRRAVVGDGAQALTPDEMAAALDYIRARPQVFEVILTGGDPLALAPRRLKSLIATLDAMTHVKSIRLHTRVPVVDPQRVDADALEADTAVWLSVHANHPDELTPATLAALKRLRRAGLALISQTVLLKGVNDDVDTLEALLRGLVAAGVKPYYLHHPDLARGTGHFRLSIDAGRALVKALRGRLSGIAQPTYVLDIPGGFGKVPLTPDHLGIDTVEDPWGGLHAYPPA